MARSSNLALVIPDRAAHARINKDAEAFQNTPRLVPTPKPAPEPHIRQFRYVNGQAIPTDLDQYPAEYWWMIVAYGLDG